MKNHISQFDEMRAHCAAFNRLDLILTLWMTAVLFMIFAVITGIHSAGVSAKRIRCTNNLKSTGIAFRLFGTDNGDKYPDSYFTNKAAWPFNLPGTNFVAPHFLAMLNSLSCASRCPALSIAAFFSFSLPMP